MTKQNQRLAGAAIIVMSSMIISRITGFLRDMLISNLGAYEGDIITAAFSSTNIMYNMLIGGAIAAALIPVLSGYIVKDDEEDGWKAVSTFINLSFIAMIAFCILGMIFAPQVVSIVSPGYSGEKRETVIQLTRILFPSVGFLLLAGLTNGVLYSYKRFSTAAYGPAIYNVGVVLSIWILGRTGNLNYIAYGIMASACFYFVIQLLFALKDFKFYRFKLFFEHPGFRRLFLIAIPSLISSSIVQINSIISQRYTTQYIEGSLNAYQNANNIWQLPYGIFAMGIGTAMLPAMSERMAMGEQKEFKDSMLRGLKMILFLIVPSAVGLIILGEPIVAGIYKFSETFDATRISLTVRILAFFTIALFAQSVLAIINRAFYAVNDTKTPLYVGGSTIILNGLLCYIFMSRTNLEAAGMSLAASISAAFNAIVLVYVLNKRLNGIYLRKLFAFSVKSIFAAGIMGVIIYFLNDAIPINFREPFSWHLKFIEVSALAFELLVAAAVYYTAMYLMKVEEALYMKNLAFGKVKRLLKR